MKYTHWTLLLCLFGALWGLVQPPMDVQDTAFNETESPVWLAHPILPQVAPRTPAIIPNAVEKRTLFPVPASETAYLRSDYSPRLSKQNPQRLLCIFLI